MFISNVNQKMKKVKDSEEIKSWREHRIERIKLRHPVYTSFNFMSCSDEKIAEMFQVLVLDEEGADKRGDVQ